MDIDSLGRVLGYTSSAVLALTALPQESPLARFARDMRRTYEPGEDDPWWYDNSAHLAAGGFIGAMAHYGLAFGLTDTALAFLACALVWELFEFRYNIRPWDEREGWSFDRAVEDTLLDTYVGLTGALLIVAL